MQCLTMFLHSTGNLRAYISNHELHSLISSLPKAYYFRHKSNPKLSKGVHIISLKSTILNSQRAWWCGNFLQVWLHVWIITTPFGTMVEVQSPTHYSSTSTTMQLITPLISVSTTFTNLPSSYAATSCFTTYSKMNLGFLKPKVSIQTNLIISMKVNTCDKAKDITI